MLRITCK